MDVRKNDGRRLESRDRELLSLDNEELQTENRSCILKRRGEPAYGKQAGAELSNLIAYFLGFISNLMFQPCLPRCVLWKSVAL